MSLEDFLSMPAPCDSCELSERCKSYELACYSYKHYVVNGYPLERVETLPVIRKKKGIHHISNKIANVPTRHIYDGIYNEKDD